MANSYFAFKEFRIDQGNCGMKVSTDACIQGAWTPLLASSLQILDIGTGTGLLSLMLAQRSPLSKIKALEIDEAAALQAKANFESSVFKSRLEVIPSDARSWTPAMLYDQIICNPPFFKNSLTGPDAVRNLARHNLTLQQTDLINLFDRVLAGEGTASVLWPSEEGNIFRQLAEKRGWFAVRNLSIKDKPEAIVKRVVAIYSRQPVNHPKEDMLIIKNEDGQYSDAFRKLMAPFYLNF